MRTQYRCRICGATFETPESLRGHIAILMETNDSNDGDHPHWDELEVSHNNLEPWGEKVPGVTDFG